MNDRSPTSALVTSLATGSGTSSPASASGATPYASRASPTTPRSGLAAAHASPSRSLGEVEELPTSGTSGPLGSSSSPSAILQSSLESRLRAELAGRGSPLFVLTWKAWDMPSGPPICALRASVPRTSASGSTSWPTPTVRHHKDGASVGTAPTNSLLGRVVWLAAWPTPLVSRGDYTYRNGNHDEPTLKLSGAAKLATWPSRAGWATPVATEISNTLESYQAMKRNMRSGPRTAITHPSLQAQLVISGPPATGSPAPTASRGQLNPEHSRWLMSLPRAWAECAPSVHPNSGATATRSSQSKRRRS